MTSNGHYFIILEVFFTNMVAKMTLPKEIQDLLDFLDEQDPFEAQGSNLSEIVLIETSIKWLTLAMEKAKSNPRLVNRPEETAKKLLDLARQFAWLKK